MSKKFEKMFIYCAIILTSEEKIMEDYFIHLTNILDDGLQWRDLLPIAVLTAGMLWKMGLVKIPQSKKPKKKG